ncbi:putative ABC transporter permease [Glaciibacter superstes]|uniref:putative ABC transporter permease n=1 Tax=Glaciibacter superstes TaxID=501023 RepID=UPI0003B4E216|nr:putative ABC transporter permease [Glaciibacter superstes]
MFLAGLAICTTIEYAVSAGLERTFGMVLWDYRDKPVNLHGRIWLQSAITWGLMSLLLIYLLDPMSIRLISAIPRPAGETALAILVTLTVSSAALTIAAFRRIRRRVGAVDATAYADEIEIESWGDRLVHRLAPDMILLGTFSHANLIVRYRALAARSPSVRPRRGPRRDQWPLHDKSEAAHG